MLACVFSDMFDKEDESENDDDEDDGADNEDMEEWMDEDEAYDDVSSMIDADSNDEDEQGQVTF